MIELILAIAFVLLSAVLKFVIGRQSTKTELFKALLELPVDLLFACIACLATYFSLISKNHNKLVFNAALETLKAQAQENLELNIPSTFYQLPFFQRIEGAVLLFVIYILIVAIVIVNWRKAEELFVISGINKKSIYISLVGYCLTITSIIWFMSLIRAVN